MRFSAVIFRSVSDAPTSATSEFTKLDSSRDRESEQASMIAFIRCDLGGLLLDRPRRREAASVQFKLPSHTTTAPIAPMQRGRALQLAAAGAVRAISSGILLSDMRRRQKRQLQRIAESAA